MPQNSLQASSSNQIGKKTKHLWALLGPWCKYLTPSLARRDFRTHHSSAVLLNCILQQTLTLFLRIYMPRCCQQMFAKELVSIPDVLRKRKIWRECGLGQPLVATLLFARKGRWARPLQIYLLQKDSARHVSKTHRQEASEITARPSVVL